MTCLTAPRGKSTSGRFRPLRFCAAAGITMTATSTATTNNIFIFIGIPCLRQPRQPSCAVTDTVAVNAVEIQNRQQHVGASLRVVREHKMTVPLERAVDSTDEFNRYFLMRVPMRVPHVGSLVDQHVIQNAAIAIRHILQLLDEVRQVLYVIAIYPGIIRLIRRYVAVVRCSMPRSTEAACREGGGAEVAAQHQCGDARDIGLE